MFQKIPNFVLAIISALLLTASWFSPFTILLFIAWVPLFIIEDKISSSVTVSKKQLAVTGLSYLTFFVWNLCVTWWIYFASFGGAVMAIVSNSLLMCTVFVIWSKLKSRVNKPWTIWLFIPLWLGFEYGHTLWDLTWTWLTIGNAFAHTHNWVQWYEYTGTSGGGLWVLIVNILIFNLIKQEQFSIKKIVTPVAMILVPIIISYVIKSTHHSAGFLIHAAMRSTTSFSMPM